MKNSECYGTSKKDFEGNGVHLFAYLRSFLSLLTVSVEKDDAATTATHHMTSSDPLLLARVSSTPKGNGSVSLQHKSKQTLHLLDYSSPYLKSTNKRWILPLSPASNEWGKIQVFRDATLAEQLMSKSA